MLKDIIRFSDDDDDDWEEFIDTIADELSDVV